MTRMLIGGAVLVGTVVAGLAGGMLERLWTPAAKEKSPFLDEMVALNVPRTIAPEGLTAYSADSAEERWLRDATEELQQAPEVMSISHCCHLLRLFKQGPFRHPQFSSGQQVLSVLTDQQQARLVFGQPIIIKTQSGIRYADPPIQVIANGENHRDLCLGTFAEIGVPLSTEFAAGPERWRLHDLLRDSVDNFHLNQEELSWTAVAYSLYLDSKSTWTNRFGEVFNWDQLAEALLSAPLNTSSCAGTHIFYSLIVMRRVDAREPLFSQHVRTKLDERLASLVASAVEHQSPDGHWPVQWWEGRVSDRSGTEVASKDSQFERLLVTGHALECLTLLPPEFAPHLNVYRRAVRWICRTLQEQKSVRERDFCPRTHAICAVRNLVEASRIRAAPVQR